MPASLKRSKFKRGKVKGHKKSRSKGSCQRSRSVVNAKEKAGGLTPKSSCLISDIIFALLHSNGKNNAGASGHTL